MNIRGFVDSNFSKRVVLSFIYKYAIFGTFQDTFQDLIFLISFFDISY